MKIYSFCPAQKEVVQKHFTFLKTNGNAPSRELKKMPLYFSTSLHSFANVNTKRMVKTFKASQDVPPGDISLLVPEGYFCPFFNQLSYNKFLENEKIRFNLEYSKKTCTLNVLSNFELIKTIGKGAFGTVYLAKSIKSGEFVVLKCISKEDIINKEIVHLVLSEKRISSTIRFNFVASVNETFMDNSFVYFKMPYLSGGDLLGHLRIVYRFEEPIVKFYAAQIVLALEYLHELKIAHRDLKPENFSLDNRGYLRLLDFGMSKIIHDKTYTFCGTPEYIAPEIILGKGYNYSADWWSLGILAYQLCSGIQPFFASKKDRLYAAIISGNFVMREFFSPQFSETLSRLITVDKSKRVGCGKGGATEVKSLKWFSDINWMALLNKKVPILYKPMDNMFGLVNFHNFKECSIDVCSQNIYKDYFDDF